MIKEIPLIRRVVGTCMKNISLDLKKLYRESKGKLQNGEILKSEDGPWEYFELMTDDGTVYVEGETCEVIKKENDTYVLQNIEDQESIFTLTKKELELSAS